MSQDITGFVEDSTSPPTRKHPVPEYVDPEPAGIWTDPGPLTAATTATSTPDAAVTGTTTAKEAPAEEESPPEERRGPSIVENQDETHPHLPATQANFTRMYQEALRLASSVSDERNRRLDGLPPRRQGDGQPAPKQPRLEQSSP